MKLYLFISGLLGLTLLLFVQFSLPDRSSQANNEYLPGLQHIFPYYVSQDFITEGFIDSIYERDLVGDSPHEKVRNYALYPLGTNNVGSLVLATAISHLSQADPLYEEDGFCGLAAWRCDGRRWQQLKNFSSFNQLDYQELKTQLIFINSELNDLDGGVFSAGKYQEVYDQLKEGQSFSQMMTLVLEEYFDKEAVDLTSLAQQLFNHQDLDSPPTPEIQVPSILDPPDFERLADYPTLEECKKGRNADGYIAKTPGGRDEKGNFLIKLEVVYFRDADVLTHTWVHRCLYKPLKKLLNDYNSQVSHEENLGGWGWRSHASQINLRKKYCGTSHYDIWEKPASECRPPAARPGKSSHQNGLAIDFYCPNKGSFKSCSSGEAFRWLCRNATKYGLINLPSEPWHWYFPLSQRSQQKLKSGQACS